MSSVSDGEMNVSILVRINQQFDGLFDRTSSFPFFANSG